MKCIKHHRRNIYIYIYSSMSTKEVNMEKESVGMTWRFEAQKDYNSRTAG